MPISATQKWLELKKRIASTTTMDALEISLVLSHRYSCLLIPAESLLAHSSSAPTRIWDSHLQPAWAFAAKCVQNAWIWPLLLCTHLGLTSLAVYLTPQADTHHWTPWLCAHLCQEPEAMEVHTDGQGPHTWLWAWIWPYLLWLDGTTMLTCSWPPSCAPAYPQPNPHH